MDIKHGKLEEYMSKKKRILFAPADDKNWELFGKQFINSLRKFHDEGNLPFLRVDNTTNDPHFFYRAKPIIARELMKEYETVIGADIDQVICGDISFIWNENEYFDVGVVMNDPSYPINLWDISPDGRYYNNGLVVMQSPEFVDHWHRLCFSPHFERYQFREQDLLNILCSDYHNYKVKWLEEKDFYGEQAKPFWAKAKMVEDKIMIGDAELKVIHFGGGNIPNKGNFKIKFQPEVVKRIEELIT